MYSVIRKKMEEAPKKEKKKTLREEASSQPDSATSDLTYRGHTNAYISCHTHMTWEKKEKKNVFKHVAFLFKLDIQHRSQRCRQTQFAMHFEVLRFLLCEWIAGWVLTRDLASEPRKRNREKKTGKKSRKAPASVLPGRPPARTACPSGPSSPSPPAV